MRKLRVVACMILHYDVHVNADADNDNDDDGNDNDDDDDGDDNDDDDDQNDKAITKGGRTRGSSSELRPPCVQHLH